MREDSINWVDIGDIPKDKEICIYLHGPYPQDTIFSLIETEEAIERGDRIINTVHPFVLRTENMRKGYRIYVYPIYGETVEIVLGNENKHTNRDIREAHNLEKMLHAYSFGEITLNPKPLTTADNLISMLRVGDKIKYLHRENGRFFLETGIVTSELDKDGVEIKAEDDTWKQYVSKYFIMRVYRNGELIFDKDPEVEENE